MHLRSLTSAAVLLLSVTGVATAATTGTTEQAANATTAQQPLAGKDVIALNAWTYDPLYANGWRTEEIWDAEVYGPTGQEIGEIENIIVGAEGKILSVIAEVGGIWDIGDTHVNVPWSQVKVSPGFERVTIPVTQENVEDYSLFKDQYLTARDAKGLTQAVDDDLMTGPRAWKLTDLVGDLVALKDRAGYGYVDDVIFSEEGEIKAVVVRPDAAYGAPGYYAYPYYGYAHGWNPGLDYYTLPYSREEIAELDRFEYDRLNDDILAVDD